MWLSELVQWLLFPALPTPMKGKCGWKGLSHNWYHSAWTKESHHKWLLVLCLCVYQCRRASIDVCMYECMKVQVLVYIDVWIYSLHVCVCIMCVRFDITSGEEEGSQEINAFQAHGTKMPPGLGLKGIMAHDEDWSHANKRNIFSFPVASWEQDSFFQPGEWVEILLSALLEGPGLAEPECSTFGRASQGCWIGTLVLPDQEAWPSCSKWGAMNSGQEKNGQKALQSPKDFHLVGQGNGGFAETSNFVLSSLEYRLKLPGSY